jgi:hypothetical protein
MCFFGLRMSLSENRFPPIARRRRKGGDGIAREDGRKRPDVLRGLMPWTR